MLYRLAAALAAMLGVAEAANWALLIAGSNTWYNYRHQADVAHAYQLLRSKGNFPASNIVTMMYDDVANNPSNPKKGQLFNKPNGPDVYNGIMIDYKGEDVNSENFLKVLSGDVTAMQGIGTGKVINSNSNDNVFVYYSDHGAFGFVGMPSGGYLYASDLNTTLGKMSQSKKFKNLVFYLEACESGSMFDSILSSHENIWAITAANPQESSYAYYYDSTIGTYLGDEFSVRWLEDAEAEVLSSASFSVEKQYELVKNAVKESHVMKYGESDLGNLPVGEFLLFNKFAPLASLTIPRTATQSFNGTDVREVEVELLKRRIAESKDAREKATLEYLLEQEISARSTIDNQFAKIVEIVTKNYKQVDHPFNAPKDFICLKASVEAFERSCRILQGYGFKYGRTIAALCDLGYGAEAISSAISKVCHPSIILSKY